MAAADAVPAVSRRERRKLEVRARILEAAVELFERQGFAETRVAEICQRADVALKTFFNHYPAKQDLLRQLAAVSIDQLLADVEEARLSATSTRERLRYFFERVAHTAGEGGPMHRELLTEIIHAAHELASDEHTRRLHAAFGRLLRDGRRDGDLRTDHALQTHTELVLGAYYVLMFNWAHLEDYPLRRRALALAKLLGDAVSQDGPGEDG